MDGHIRQHQGIYQTIVNMTQTYLYPKSSGSRERPGTMWHKPNRFLLSATQAAAPGAYRLLILCLSLCVSLSLSLSLSLSHTHTHTHTEDTDIVMLCFLLESLNPSLTSPDLPENWKMWMVWEYGCFFYSEVKYLLSYLGLENRRGLPCSPALPLQGALVQFLIRKLRFFFFLPMLHGATKKKEKKDYIHFFSSVPLQ